MSASKSLRALLTNSIDYAGLFPPASLELEPTLKNFASYVRSDDAWMLSTFVLPISRFTDAAWFLSEFNQDYPLRISALGPKTINETDFVEELKNVRRGIQELAASNSVRIEQLEMPLPQEFDHRIFSAIRDVPTRCFWEAPADDAKRIIALLAEQSVDLNKNPLGFKLRTGGVTADAFPTSAQVAHVLVTAAKHEVPIKFTAGLHHPVRMYRDEVKTKMHGFLNVLGAGVLAIEHGWDEEQATIMLDDEDAAAFKFTDDAFAWRDSKITTDRIARHRQFITSFGSCSFDEPGEDLRALELL